MGRDMNDLQPIGVQHHSVVFAVRQMGQQLGMPGVVMSGQMQRFFIQWRRGNRFYVPAIASSVARFTQR